MVGLVDDDEVRRLVGSPGHGLDHAELDLMRWIWRPTGGDDAVRDTEGSQRGRRLVNKLLTVDEDHRSVTLGRSLLGDVREHHRLAAASR